MSAPSDRITRRRALAAGGAAVAFALAFDRRWVMTPYSPERTTDSTDWPLPQGGPARTGYSPAAVTVPQTAAFDWQTPVDSVPAGIIGAGDRLVALTYEGTITAIDRHSGRQLWHRSTVDGSTLQLDYASGPVLTAGTLIATDGATVFALNPEDGSTEWEYHTNTRVRGMVALGTTVFTRVDLDESIATLALDVTTGLERYRIDGEQTITPLAATPGTVVGRRVTNPARLTAIDPATGHRRWSTHDVLQPERPIGRIRGFPCISNGTLVTGEKPATAFSMDDGSILWERSIRPDRQPDHDSDVERRLDWTVLANDTVAIVVDHERGGVVGLALDTGSVLWRQSVADLSDFAPVLTRNTLFLGHSTGLYQIDTNTGQHRTPARTNSLRLASPIVIDGTLYALTDTAIVCSSSDEHTVP